MTFIEPGTLVAVYEEPGEAPLKNGEEYDLTLLHTLRGIFHDGVSPITEVKLLARSFGLVRDTGHYDVATRVVDSDWTPARRGARLTSKGTSARTPARTSARAPRPDFYDDEDIDYEVDDDDDDDDGDENGSGGNDEVDTDDGGNARAGDGSGTAGYPYDSGMDNDDGVGACPDSDLTDHPDDDHGGGLGLVLAPL